MNKLRIPLSLVAASMLAACAGGYDEPVSAAPGVVVAPVVAAPAVTVAPAAVYPAVVPQQAVPAVRAGIGRVDSITPLADAYGAQLAQSRLGLRMQDGTAQFVDARATNIAVGDRVEITRDSHIRYPVP